MRKRNVHIQFWLNRKEAEALDKKVRRSGLSREAYALLFIRGERPVMDEKYNPLKHPNVALTALGGAPTYEHGKTDHVTATISIGTVTESEPPEPETAVDDTMELLSNEEIEALFHLI